MEFGYLKPPFCSLW